MTKPETQLKDPKKISPEHKTEMKPQKKSMKSAFVHKFLKEGLTSSEFNEAHTSMIDIIEEYKKYEVS